MENNSGLKPVGRAVLVQPYEPEKKKSIIELPKSVEDRMATLEDRAIVIEAGPSAWMDEKVPRAQPGDKVILASYSGRMIVGTKDSIQYRIVNDKDIFAVIVEEVQ